MVAQSTAAIEKVNRDCSQSRSQSSNNSRDSALNQQSEEDNQEDSSIQSKKNPSLISDEEEQRKPYGKGTVQSTEKPETGAEVSAAISIKSQMNNWIEILKGTTPQSEASLNLLKVVEPSADEPKSGNPPSIDLDDIIDEIAYWESAMICYVLGANPPLKVMEGFVHRKWKHHGLDKLVGIGKGIFLARFHDKNNMLKIYNGDHIFFDSKPLIMKPWNPDIDVIKEDVKTVPMWIKLPGLDLKY